uniref:Uncharacterized protein n=1 Tax=viral metagenome TaxID=1070528 RepID=A0A6C0D2R2_9ZZZZ
MKKANIELFFDYFNFATYYYTPTKYNKKKIKTLCESLPFFLPETEQNKIYELFLKFPVHSFNDSTQRMREYGFLIYMEYHKKEKIKYLDYPSYLDKLETKLYTNSDDIVFTKKRVHTLLFCILVIILFICLYRL